MSTRRYDPRLFLCIFFMTAVSGLMLSLLLVQPAGIDFLAMWAGGKAAGLDMARLYDMGYVTALQDWPRGPGVFRPFPYPPTALFLFAPLSALPWPVAYALWLGVSIPAFAWAGLRMGAPWWFLLFPWVTFAAYCGQVTLLFGALFVLGLVERRSRPFLSGVLFGVAAATKPQLVLLLPVALLVERSWTVLVVTGVTGLTICAAAAAVWGLGPWLEWPGSLASFTRLVGDDASLNASTITPTAALWQVGVDTRWAVVAVVPAVSLVWWAFRRERPIEDQLIALAGGTILVSPYSLKYELAIFAPAVAIYLARTQDRGWTAYLAASVAASLPLQPALLNLLAVLSLCRWRFKAGSPNRDGADRAGLQVDSPEPEVDRV